MKYLLVILLSLFLFQVSYTQEVEAEIEDEGESEIGEAFFEELIEAEEEANAGGWIDVNLDDFNNDDFSQQTLRFGSQWVISQLIGYNTISNSSSWNISQVNWVEGQRINGVNYKINALWEDDEGDFFIGEFIINALAIGPNFKVLSVTYTLGNGDAEVELVDEEELELPSENALPPIAPAGEEVEAEDGEIWLGAWSELDVQEVQNDADIKPLLDGGVNFAIQKALAEGTLPAGTWKLQSLDGAKRQLVAGAKYAFSVKLTDGDIMRAGAEIFVFQDLDNSWSVLSSGLWFIGVVSA